MPKATFVSCSVYAIVVQCANFSLSKQEVKLVEVTSNIWGTKFKIHGLAKTVPANLGQVTYKTSLLHLQPRQMTLVITELRDDFPPGPDPSFNPNLFSEDEEEHHNYNSHTHNHNHNHNQDAVPAAQLETVAALKPPIMPQRRLNDGSSSPPIAPMSPRPNRILARHRNSHSLTVNGAGGGGGGGTASSLGLSPLARAESYDDDSSNESQDALANANAHSNGNTSSTTVLLHQAPSTSTAAASCSKNITRPKTISSFKNSYSRSSSNSSCQSRHAISPLYCDGSVPTLQSPKNAVAPSDIIFERPAVPAAGQTTLMSYSSNADYANNVVQVKNALMSEPVRSANSHVNPVPLNLNLNLERMDARAVKCSTAAPSTSTTKRRDMLYIDEETQSPTPNTASTSTTSSSMKRTPTVVSIAPALPDSITRSCSVGYLDSVAITPSDEALSALRKDAPNKRLILVDKRRNRNRKRQQQQQADARRNHKLQQTGKSKSLDSCDLLSLQTKLSSKEHEQVVRKLQEISDSSACSSAANTLCFKCRNNMNPSSACKRCQPTNIASSALDEITTAAATVEPIREVTGVATAAAATSVATATKPTPKKRFDVITSFTDSPLFTRKHRFGYGRSKELAAGSSTENSTPLLPRKQENSFSFSWRRKEPVPSQTQIQASSSNGSTLERQHSDTGNVACGTVEATPVEAKASVSLHTQVSSVRDSNTSIQSD